MELGLAQTMEAVANAGEQAANYPQNVSQRSKRYHKRTREQFNALQVLDKETQLSTRRSSLEEHPQKRICTDPRPGVTENDAISYRLVLDAAELDRQMDHKMLPNVAPDQQPPRYPFVDTPFTVDVALMHATEQRAVSRAHQVNGVAMVTLLYENGEPANPDYLVMEDPDPNPPAQRTDVPWSPTNPGVLPVVGGVLQFRCAINRLSAQEGGRRFKLRVTLGSSAGVAAEPMDIGLFEMVRYRLQIAKEPEPYFFKDQGGQRHGLTAHYQLVEARTASSQPLPEAIKLKVGLVYEDLKPIDVSDSPGDILLSPKSQKRGHKKALTHTTMDGRTRKGSIKYRIEECSSVGHKNRAFRFTIALDPDNPELMGVAPCFTRKTHVMAKDLWKEKLKKACKLYRWDDSQCHVIHDDYQRQQSHSSAKPDPYNRWRSPEEVRAWMISEEGKQFSNTSYGHKKTHSRLRGNPTPLPPMPMGNWPQGMQQVQILKVEDAKLPPQVVQIKREDMMRGSQSAMSGLYGGMMPLSAMSLSERDRLPALPKTERRDPMTGLEERAYNRIKGMMGSAHKIAARLAKEGYPITPQSILPVLLEDVMTRRNVSAQRDLAMECLRENAVLENPREFPSPTRFLHESTSESTSPETLHFDSRKSSIESAPSHKSSIDSAPSSSRKSSVEEGELQEECFPPTRQDRSSEQSSEFFIPSYAVGCLPPLPVPATTGVSLLRGLQDLNNYYQPAPTAHYPLRGPPALLPVEEMPMPRMGNLGGKLGGFVGQPAQPSTV